MSQEEARYDNLNIIKNNNPKMKQVNVQICYRYMTLDFIGIGLMYL